MRVGIRLPATRSAFRKETLKRRKILPRVAAASERKPDETLLMVHIAPNGRPAESLNGY